MSKIITSQQVTDRTGADAATAELVARAINQQIETATGRVWGETKTVTEVYDRANVLWLRQMDIQAVTSVKVGYPHKERTAVETGSYSFNPFGRLVLSYAPNRALPPATSDYVEVTFSYGVPAQEVPADLILAALNLASSYYKYGIEQGGQEVASESIGSYKVEYANRNGASTAPSRDWQVINAYAKRRA